MRILKITMIGSCYLFSFESHSEVAYRPLNGELSEVAKESEPSHDVNESSPKKPLSFTAEQILAKIRINREFDIDHLLGKCDRSLPTLLGKAFEQFKEELEEQNIKKSWGRYLYSGILYFSSPYSFWRAKASEKMEMVSLLKKAYQRVMFDLNRKLNSDEQNAYCDISQNLIIGMLNASVPGYGQKRAAGIFSEIFEKIGNSSRIANKSELTALFEEYQHYERKQHDSFSLHYPSLIDASAELVPVRKLRFSDKTTISHFTKHKTEFNDVYIVEDYKDRANAFLRRDSDSCHSCINIFKENKFAKFDPNTGEELIFDKSGNFISYFVVWGETKAERLDRYLYKLATH
jgi:hypothetical protein